MRLVPPTADLHRLRSAAIVSVLLLLLCGCAVVPQAPPQAPPQPQPPAPAAIALVETVSPAQLLQLMQDQGYAASIDDGDILWMIDGHRTFIVFALENQVLLFRAGFGGTEATLEAVNDWNQSRLFTRSYLDRHGAVFLEVDLDLMGGVAPLRIVEFLRTCRTSFQAWHHALVRERSRAPGHER
jgi:hypothetical protein